MRPYILIEHEPIRVPDDDMLLWADWMAAGNRIVKREEVGPYLISTVFLGLDHNFSEHGPPLLFETMIFCDGESLDYQRRCSTWAEAEAQHEAAAAFARRHAMVRQ